MKKNLQIALAALAMLFVLIKSEVGLSQSGDLKSQAMSSLSLNQFLEIVQQNNSAIKSLQAQQKASETRYEQANLELSPVFNANVSYLDDQAPQPFGPTTFRQQMEVRDYSFGFAQKFATGTSASITSGVQGVSQTLNTSGSLSGSEVNTGYLSLAVSQSLWKDAFGNATRLRLKREQAQKTAEISSLNLQIKQQLSAAETIYWENVLAEDNLKTRQDSLARAERILGWITRRVSNGIGDQADLLNAQGLVAMRKLELLNAQDQVRTAQKKFFEALQIDSLATFPKLTTPLSFQRPAYEYIQGLDEKNNQSAQVIRLDAYLASLEADAKSTAAMEVQDSLKPDLVLEGQYRTNGTDTTLNSAYSNSTRTDAPTTGVALKFTWMLDWDRVGAVKNTAQLDAQAATYNAERKKIESLNAWSEFLRAHKELSLKISAAENMARIQSQRAQAQRDKLSKGRAVTSDVITAEQDAADSELVVMQLKTEQRKLESQSRLFIRQEGAL